MGGKTRVRSRVWAALLALCACTGDVGVPSASSQCGQGACADGPGGLGGPAGGSGSSTGSGAGDPASVNGLGSSTRLARLSNAQWENTVVDLLRLPAPSGLSSNLTPEPADRGYDTEAAAELTIGSDSATRYESAAGELAARVKNDASLLGQIAPSGGDDDARRDNFLRSFGRRAYRRPLEAEELATLRTLFDLGAEDGAFADGVEIVISAVLQSPNFLYRVERSVPDKGDIAFLDGYEVASRLSYAIWHSMPSDALLDAAEAGELDDAEGVKKWAHTLLNDERATPVLVSFLEQTFGIASYGTQDKAASMGFDAAALAPTLRGEARAFFEQSVLGASGGGITDILTSTDVYVNEDTAKFYGIDGVSGDALVRRAMASDERSGLFTQLGFLSKNATRSGSDPVHRGLVILRRVLCDEPDPPPAMFSLPEPMEGLTTRETYERATACGAGCHDTMINPPGFAFETFDTIGRVRSEEAGKPIDSAASLLIRDGFDAAAKAAGKNSMLTFTGAVDMLQQLADTPRVHECYARNLMSFVLGREVSSYERGVSQSLGNSSREQGGTRELLETLMTFDTFRARVDNL